MKRQRGRGRKPSNPNNRSFESNGPDVKIRGNASQVYDKYLQYARDAQTSGDRIAAEAYFQHAEHYYRIMAANMPKERPPQQNHDGQSGDVQDDQNAQTSEQNAAQQTLHSGEAVDNLQVVDGSGEQASDIETNSADDGASDERPRRRTRRPRRRPQSETTQTSSTEVVSEVAASDDAGLRAMMSRTPVPEVSEAPKESDSVEEAES